MLSLKELQEKTGSVHKESAFLQGRILFFRSAQACLLTLFLGTLTVNLWVYVCNPRSEELSLYPLRQIIHPEGSSGIAHGHPHGGEESEVRLL